MLDKEILTKIKAGATVAVQEKNGGTFQGLVIARKHGSEKGATFTVRAAIKGVGVEKVYPIESPNILKVKIIKSPKKVSRAKLYYLRDLSKKSILRKTAIEPETIAE